MRKIATTVLLCTFLFALEAFGIQAEAAKGEAQAKSHLSHISAKLKLTADQQSKIQAILADEHQQHMSLDRQSLAVDAKMAKAHAMHAATDAKIRALLNADQKKEFDRIVHGKGNGPATANHVKTLSAGLSLSADQQSKLKGLLEQQHQQHMALARDASLSKADKVSKANSLHQETEKKFREILNDEQKKKFDQHMGTPKESGHHH